MVTGSIVGVIGQPQRHRILSERIGQLVDAAFHGEAGGMLEGRAHVARRLDVGADQPLTPRKFGKP